MGQTPVALDHVNVFVRNVERSYEWYQEVFQFHTQDTMTHPGTNKLRATVFWSEAFVWASACFCRVTSARALLASFSRSRAFS